MAKAGEGPGPGPDLGPVSADFVVRDHVSGMGRALYYGPAGAPGKGGTSVPQPGLAVFPGCVVRVTWEVIGVRDEDLPRPNPFLYGEGSNAEERARVRGFLAEAKRIKAALRARAGGRSG